MNTITPPCPPGRNPTLWAIAADAVARHDSSYDGEEADAALGAARAAARRGQIQAANVSLAARGALALMGAVRAAMREAETASRQSAASSLRCGEASVQLGADVDPRAVAKLATESTPAAQQWGALAAASQPGDVCVVEATDAYYPKMWIARGEHRVRAWTRRGRVTVGIRLAADEDAEEARALAERARPAVAGPGPEYRESTGDGIRDARNWAEDAYRCGDSWSDE